MPRGGLRNPKGGRPVGAKNKIPGGKDFNEKLKTVARQYEETEYLAMDAANARELLQKIYQSKEVPIKYRLYAATKMVEVEPTPITIEEQTAEVDEAYEFLLAEAAKRRKAMMCDRDEKLHKWIADGLMTEATALLVRGLWTKPRAPADVDAEFEDGGGEIPPWQPVKPPEIAWNEGQARDKNSSATAHNGGNGSTSAKMANGITEYTSVASAQPQPNGEETRGWSPRIAIGQFMFGQPHRSFWIGDKRYDADQFGEVDVTDAPAEVVEELARHGYRKQR